MLFTDFVSPVVPCYLFTHYENGLVSHHLFLHSNVESVTNCHLLRVDKKAVFFTIQTGEGSRRIHFGKHNREHNVLYEQLMEVPRVHGARQGQTE